MIFEQDGGGRVFVDPLWVTGVREVEVRKAEGYRQLAVVSTRGGGEPYVVRDPERTVVDLIGEAKAKAGSAPERIAQALEALGLSGHGAE